MSICLVRTGWFWFYFLSVLYTPRLILPCQHHHDGGQSAPIVLLLGVCCLGFYNDCSAHRVRARRSIFGLSPPPSYISAACKPPLCVHSHFVVRISWVWRSYPAEKSEEWLSLHFWRWRSLGPRSFTVFSHGIHRERSNGGRLPYRKGEKQTGSCEGVLIWPGVV